MYAFNDLTTWHLARLADVLDPDTHDGIGFTYNADVPSDVSAGAEFLRNVAHATAEALNDPNLCDGFVITYCDLDEAACGAVSVYTYDLWTTFTDLGLWAEIPELVTDWGAEALVGQSDDLPRFALATVAERLAVALAERVGVRIDN